MDQSFDFIIVGGGAAGYFAALRAAAVAPESKVLILEAGRRPLDKVRVSGGGRCNVTHHCFDPKLLVENYPRGSRELRGPFSRFQPQDTVAWFAERGVELKAEVDGRMFPVTDESSTIINCLETERRLRNVSLLTDLRVTAIEKRADGKPGFLVSTEKGQFTARKLLLATGSNRSGYAFAQHLGHKISPLAPSLFTFNVGDPELHALSGVSVPEAALSLFIDEKLVKNFSGPLLITHWGLSGPAVLKLSAFAARELQQANYQAKLSVNWAGTKTEENISALLLQAKKNSPKKMLSTFAAVPMPIRLWEYLLRRAMPEALKLTWNEVSNAALQKLAREITQGIFLVAGKGQFKEEFVTCGGVFLSEVDFRTMESKITPGLFLAGELLDIDGITGGFNFQSAWTTGWIAGTAMGEV